MTRSTMRRLAHAAILAAVSALLAAASGPAASQGDQREARKRNCSFDLCHARCVQRGGTFGSASKHFRCSNRCARRCLSGSSPQSSPDQGG
jgi:hypothetical protein